jgi:hypothetical protein
MGRYGLAKRFTPEIANNQPGMSAAPVLAGTYDVVAYAFGNQSRLSATSSVTAVFSVNVTNPPVHAGGTVDFALTTPPSKFSRENVLNMGVEGSDVGSYRYAITHGSSDCTQVTYSDTVLAPAPITYTTTREGLYTLCVLVTACGIEQAYPLIYSWYFDITPPAPFKLTQLSSVAPTTTQAKGFVTANWTQSDPGISYEILLASQDDLFYFAPSSRTKLGVHQFNASVSAAPGVYAVCIRATDLAGNEVIATAAELKHGQLVQGVAPGLGPYSSIILKSLDIPAPIHYYTLDDEGPGRVSDQIKTASRHGWAGS